MLEDLVDRAFDAVLLELEEGFPNVGVDDFDVLVEQAALVLVGQEFLKDVEQGLVVDELGRVVLVKLVEVEQHFLLYVFDQFGIVPEFVEPGFQVAAVAVAVHLQVEFDVVVARRQGRGRAP